MQIELLGRCNLRCPCAQSGSLGWRPRVDIAKGLAATIPDFRGIVRAGALSRVGSGAH